MYWCIVEKIVEKIVVQIYFEQICQIVWLSLLRSVFLFLFNNKKASSFHRNPIQILDSRQFFQQWKFLQTISHTFMNGTTAMNQNNWIDATKSSRKYLGFEVKQKYFAFIIIQLQQLYKLCVFPFKTNIDQIWFFVAPIQILVAANAPHWCVVCHVWWPKKSGWNIPLGIQQVASTAIVVDIYYRRGLPYISRTLPTSNHANTIHVSTLHTRKLLRCVMAKFGR